MKYINILILIETKLDKTFLVSPLITFLGVMIYIRGTIPTKILEKHSCPNDIECLFTELNFRKCKWPLWGTYHPPS